MSEFDKDTCKMLHIINYDTSIEQMVFAKHRDCSLIQCIIMCILIFYICVWWYYDKSNDNSKPIFIVI